LTELIIVFQQVNNKDWNLSDYTLGNKSIKLDTCKMADKMAELGDIGSTASSTPLRRSRN
jgi:hypothetical protein